MKLRGRVVNNTNIAIVVIPREDEPLVFRFKPVIKFDEFDNYVKLPEPPTIQPNGKPKFKDFEDADYKTELTKYAVLKHQWMFLESISATEQLEFETVKRNDPTTWHLVQKELEDAELTITERNMLLEGFNSANSLDEDKLRVARDSFLASAQAGH